MGLGFWISLAINVILAFGFLNLYSILSQLRTKNHGLRQAGSRAILRSNRWKHYAHHLEIELFETENAELNRDEFRAQYIPDFQGWGNEYVEAQELRSVPGA